MHTYPHEATGSDEPIKPDSLDPLARTVSGDAESHASRQGVPAKADQDSPVEDSRLEPETYEAGTACESLRIVTLDELRPFDHNPRTLRNPAYDEIKASIRERGLDSVPVITRRTGESHYIIYSGGNTRLSILRELYAETGEERFSRLTCRYRPWTERGELEALTGHLAENELRGGLTFIERAKAIQRAQALYEQEAGRTLSQSELARRLNADGYPVRQSHISRMQEALRYLLPAIPTVLYAGLGRHQVERLAILRRACERTWQRLANHRERHTFAELFQHVLAQFDSTGEHFCPRRVQDELIAQMAAALGMHYEALALDIDHQETRQRALSQTPPLGSHAPGHTPNETGSGTTSRLMAIQQLIARHTGEPFAQPGNTPHMAQPSLARDESSDHATPPESVRTQPEHLREQIAHVAQQLARDAGVEPYVSVQTSHLGFSCTWPTDAHALQPTARTVLILLHALNGTAQALPLVDRAALADGLGVLLHGQAGEIAPLSRPSLSLLFRLIRHTRHLNRLEAGSFS
ncbi:ParB N-terminal domain-containing protein [Pseudomonas sp. CBMAI 2609]|uniref:ParB N-terminal domain-containing protein n=1 Tax=Pseudomonas flavocrustae TaxID=2991719 RepID=A0ABT6IFR8_9PSED|nr:ParB family protein [Pseudomonas sp. CBMAI 2609]MDH4763357.1 ParB N-terminal domain-containing protein [Pseudomonas sp. CBMAI 2609]